MVRCLLLGYLRLVLVDCFFVVDCCSLFGVLVLWCLACAVYALSFGVCGLIVCAWYLMCLVCCSLLVARCLLFVVCGSLFILRCLLCVVACSVCVVCGLLYVVRCLLYGV